MRLKVFSVSILGFVISLPLTAKKSTFPEQIVNAQSVAIMYLSASGPQGDVNTPGISTQDRDVLNAVDQAFHKWKRYLVTIDPRQADIIIAVRTAQDTVNSGIATGKVDGRRSSQVSWGADIGPNVDMIQIYSANTLSPDRDLIGPLLWTGAEKSGLSLPALPLMQRLHQEVDEAVKNKTKP